MRVLIRQSGPVACRVVVFSRGQLDLYNMPKWTLMSIYRSTPQLCGAGYYSAQGSTLCKACPSRIRMQ
ncbi:hypothetical protein GQ600_14079 [Phytophthora cactorum]|nr:hypothetical protein GQ600_14079 [Phytophthora cactorum]